MESNNLFDLLQGQLSDNMLDHLSQQLGGASREQTAVASKSIISSLLGGLSQNVRSEEGARSLDNALERDHDGSILDDVMGFLSGNRQVQNQKMLDGEGIVNHILGDRQSNIMDLVSRMSGFDKSKTGSLLRMLAPVVLGALGKTKRQQGLDSGGLANLLTNIAQPQSQQHQPSGLVDMLLDRDRDGSYVDDVANIGMSLLGNFFKR